MRTGRSKTCSASSRHSVQQRRAAGEHHARRRATRFNPFDAICLSIRPNSSVTRGSMIPLSTWRVTRRGSRPATIVHLRRTSVPTRASRARTRASTFKSLGLAGDVRRPYATSLVMLLPAETDHAAGHHRAVRNHEDVGGAAADVEHHGAGVALFFRSAPRSPMRAARARFRRVRCPRASASSQDCRARDATR